MITMLNKIKNILNVEKSLDSLYKKVYDQEKAVEELGINTTDSLNELKSLKDEIKQISGIIKTIKTDSEKTNISLKHIFEDLRDQINDFKIIKGQLAKKLFENMKKELQENMSSSFEHLKTDVNQFNSLKIKMESVCSQVDNLEAEIKKFNEIAKNIKQQDFCLTKYAKKLESQDREKLNLMKQIDSLQRLLGKERRQQR